MYLSTHFKRMTMREEIIIVANDYAKYIGKSRSRISTLIFNRGTKIDELMFGKADVYTATYERVMQYFSNNWPQNATWPQNVARPIPTNQNNQCLQEGAQ